MTQPNPNNPSPEMIEAGVAAYTEPADFQLTNEMDFYARKVEAIYLAMQAQQPNPSPDRVERAAELISDYVAWRRWDNMAEDKADLRLKMRGGDYDVNEPTKSDCREAARAALAKDGEV